MCDACKPLVNGDRMTEGHAKLKEIGTDHRRGGMTGAVLITRYVCSECGTKWRYQDDRGDPWVGWTVIK